LTKIGLGEEAEKYRDMFKSWGYSSLVELAKGPPDKGDLKDWGFTPGRDINTILNGLKELKESRVTGMEVYAYVFTH